MQSISQDSTHTYQGTEDPFPHIPLLLKQQKRWVYYRLEAKPDEPGKYTKIPTRWDLDGAGNPRNASTTRPGYFLTWLEFLAGWHQREKRNPHIAGPGFCLYDQYSIKVLDHDKAFGPDGQLKPHQQQIMNGFPSWRERSASGQGAHTFFLDFLGQEIPSFKNREHGIELFSGSGFIAMTGQPFTENELPLQSCLNHLPWLLQTYGHPGKGATVRQDMPPGVKRVEVELVRGEA